MKSKPEKILLVEDEEAHAELVRRAFDDYDSSAEVIVAATLKSARAILRDSPPDIVFIDMMLPDGNGIELLSELTEDTPFPAVIVTSHGNEKLAVGAMKAGALDYVVKSEAMFSTLPQIAGRVFREWTHIIEKKAAEKALAASEAKSRAMLAAIPDRIYGIRSDGLITFFKEAQSDSGGKRLSPDSETIYAVFPDNVSAKYAKAMSDTLSDGLTRQFETSLPEKGGTRHFEVRIARINGGEALAISRDVTDEHNMESHLMQSQKLEALGQLAGGVAHDFNNLLTGILAFSRMLKDELKDNESAQGDLQEVIDAAERAADLTSTLLTFSRQQPIKTREVNVTELVSKFAALLKRVIGEEIELELKLADEVPLVSADPGQLEQVVMNLVINAKDAIERRGTVKVETGESVFDSSYLLEHPWVRPGRYTLIGISDDGCGIPSEIREHIFEPFFTTKPQGEGTGLGLATVYGIVTQHGGFVHCYSEKERGTTFKVYLPVSSRKAESVGTKLEKRPSGGTETILLADDEEIIRKSAVRALEKAGYEVVAVADGQEALDKFRENPAAYDLVLLDIVMPKLGGDEAARAILKIRPDVKLVMSSGYSPMRAGQILTPLPEGTPFVSKPYSTNELLRVVREAMDG